MTLKEIREAKKRLGDRIRESKILRNNQGRRPTWVLQAKMFDGMEKTFYTPADIDAYFEIYF